jgi:hypothetical protein
MRRNGHARYYDRLTPEERFRLDILAMARGDKVESDRLSRTCPRRTYTMNERGFTGRWFGAMDITLRTYLHLAGYLEQLKIVEVVRVMLSYPQTFAREAALEAYIEGHQDGARHAWRASGKRGALRSGRSRWTRRALSLWWTWGRPSSRKSSRG